MSTDDGTWNEADEWQRRFHVAGATFAAECAELRDTNPLVHVVLDAMMSFMASELWDHSFSQTEIRHAFEHAVAGLVPYSAGEDRRGDRERPPSPHQ